MEIHLQTYGARLRVRGGLFLIEVPDLSGQYSLQREEEYAAQQIKTILLESGASASAGALLLALENGTGILVLDGFGHPVGRLWPNRPCATIAIQKAQLAWAIPLKAFPSSRIGW